MRRHGPASLHRGGGIHRRRICLRAENRHASVGRSATRAPNSVLALGAVFNALEVVPLVLIGFEAWENIRLYAAAPTPVHGHTALFGVYGMLGLGLMLFCLRALRPGLMWKDRPLAIAFWSINIGLVAMVMLSMLPIGLFQAWASVEYGTWYARSSEFMQTPMLTNLRWMRMIGDTLFALGALVLGWFVLGLVTGHSFDHTATLDEGEYSHRSLEEEEVSVGD